MPGMYAPRGTYKNPADRYCFVPCTACVRCSQRGKYAKCSSCSGRPDRYGERVPHPEDVCRCSEGILQWITKDGEKLVAKYNQNPFGGYVNKVEKADDERDWEDWLKNKREMLDDQEWDPIKLY